MTSKSMKDITLKTKTVVAAATLVTSFGVASNVHADEPMNETETVSNHNVVTEDSTKAKVETAKANLDNVNAALASQEEVVKNAEASTSDAQATYDTAKEVTAQTQQLANEATSEAIEKAQANVTSAKNQIGDAQAAQLKSEETESQAKEAVKAQESVVAQAQEKVDKAQADVAVAQKQVDQAQAILDGTGQQAVIDEQAAAQADELQKREELQVAQNKLEQAKKADEERLKAIESAQQKVEDAKNNRDIKKSDLDSKEKTVKAAQTAFEKVKKEFETAENDYNSINTFTVSQEYVDALRLYMDGNKSREEREEAIPTLIAEGAKLRKVNNFKANKNEENGELYDVNNLPDHIIQEISFFGSDLINQVREKFNTSKTYVTPSSIKFADMVTDTYKRDNFDIWLGDGHHVEGIKEVAASYGLPQGQFYENWAGSISRFNQMNLSQLKEKVYDSITRFLFSDVEWDHAQSIAGLDFGRESSGDTYIAIDTYVGPGEFPWGGGNYFGTHFLTIKSSFTEGTSFDKTKISNPKSSEIIVERYKSVKDLFEKNQELLNVTEKDLSVAQESYDKSEVKLSAANQALQVAQNVKVQTSVAKVEFDNSLVVYKAASDRLQKANQALAALEADVKQKQDQVVDAKKILVAKTTDLQTAESILTQAQDRLVDLQKNLDAVHNDVMVAKANVDKAQSNLNQAQNYLAKLQNSPKLLAEAKMAEEVAQNDLLQATKKLEVELLVLQNLQKQQAVAKEVYEAAVREYQAFLVSQEQKRLQSEYLNLVAQGKQPVPIFDEVGKVIGYVANTPNTKQLVVPTSMLAEKSVKDSNSLNLASDMELKVEVLPTTGTDSSAALTVAGMTMLATLGTVKAKRRKF